VGIIDKLNERNPLHHVRNAFNEKELAQNATRSALNKVNKKIHDIAAEMKATRERLAREAGQTRRED
jgi:histidinol-phosphate/aromatic aminotransferase/cobyric acid decarboxylase-like protein